MNKPPFHPFTEKKVGDHVKIPRNPLRESEGFIFGRVTSIGYRTMATTRGIVVRWDEFVPRLCNDILPSEVAIMA